MSDAIDIFISYRREDRTLAESLAKRLTDGGLRVYYDIQLEHGQDFADELDARIRAARLVVVLWTEAAVASSWVRREARFAAELDRYFPVHFDQVDLPVDLRGRHAVQADPTKDLEDVVDAIQRELASPGSLSETTQPVAGYVAPSGHASAARPSWDANQTLNVNPVRGGVLMLLGVLGLMILGVSVRELSTSPISTIMITAFASLIATTILGGWNWWRGEFLSVHSKVWTIFRTVLFTASLFLIVAMWESEKQVELATGFMLSAFLLTLICRFALAPRAAWIARFATFIGTCGCLALALYSINSSGLEILLSLCIGLLYAASAFVTSLKCRAENPVVLSGLALAGLTLVLFLLGTAGLKSGSTDGSTSWFETILSVILLGGLMAGVAYALTRAYQLARPELLIPIEFFRVPLAILFAGSGLTLMSGITLALTLLAGLLAFSYLMLLKIRHRSTGTY